MIEIKNPKSVIDKCSNVLKDLLDTDFFTLRKEENGSDYKLVGKHQTSALATPVRYSVLPLNVLSEVPFWLAVDLTIIRDEEGFKIVAISIVFFEGDALDDDKTPLIRAEWDPHKEGHAQPHWHVYPNAIKQSSQSSESTLFLQEQPILEFSESEVILSDTSTRPRLEEFHFPMLGGWHLEPPSPIETEFSEKSACQWIGGCVSYTSSQLAYLKRVPL